PEAGDGPGRSVEVDVGVVGGGGQAAGVASGQALRGGGPAGRLLQSVVAAAAAWREVGAGVDGRLPVELLGADPGRGAGLRTLLPRRVPPAVSGQPVGQVPDGFVVVEVRLAYPALDARATDHVHAVFVLLDGEAGVVDRGRAKDDPGRLGGGRGGACLGEQPRDSERELPQALVRGGADLEDRPAQLLQLGPGQLGHGATVGHVDPVQRDQPGPVLQTAVRGQLRLQRRDIRGWIAVRLQRGRVHHVYEDGAALDVPQELQAQPLAGGRARDQARHVGDHERVAVDLNDAEVGYQRGERVVGNLGPGGGHGRDQRRLAGRREAHQPDVGDALEFEHHLQHLARLTQLGEARRAAASIGERRVATPAPATLRDLERGPGAHEIGEYLAAPGLDDGAVGYPYHQ